MIENLQTVAKGELKDALGKLKARDYRLITIIGAIVDDRLEVTYALESKGDMQFAGVRTYYGFDEEVASVQDIYLNAMLYEWEISDLFDVNVENAPKGALLEPEKRGPFRRDV
jgi:NADH:ubiquinone oxidoreductase subunit C